MAQGWLARRGRRFGGHSRASRSIRQSSGRAAAAAGSTSGCALRLSAAGRHKPVRTGIAARRSRRTAAFAAGSRRCRKRRGRSCKRRLGGWGCHSWSISWGLLGDGMSSMGSLSAMAGAAESVLRRTVGRRPAVVWLPDRTVGAPPSGGRRACSPMQPHAAPRPLPRPRLVR